MERHRRRVGLPHPGHHGEISFPGRDLCDADGRASKRVRWKIHGTWRNDARCRIRQGNTWVVSFLGRGQGGASSDTVVAAAETFAVVRHVFTQGKARTESAYRDGHYRGTRVDSAGRHEVDISAPADRLDLALVGPITEALPHSVGREDVLLAFDAPVARDRAKDISYRVVDQDTPSWRGESVTAWKTVTDLGTHQVTSWLSMDGSVLRWEITRPGTLLVGLLRP
jgi:hypothetical protein